MLHALSVLSFAGVIAGTLLVIVETLMREHAAIVAALRMIPRAEQSRDVRVTRVRYAAGLRQAPLPAIVPARARLLEAA